MTTEIIFPGRLPGNNGKDGLLRMHHREKTNLRNRLFYWVRAATRNRHTGPVRLELVRHGYGTAMDYDNLVSTGKIPLDALVLAGILPEDNPLAIAERDYRQTRAKNSKSQYTLIRIIDLDTLNAEPHEQVD